MQQARGGPLQTQQQKISAAQKRMEELMKQMEEEEAAQVVRLGDASIAAPFTSRYSSIQSSARRF